LRVFLNTFLESLKRQYILGFFRYAGIDSAIPALFIFRFLADIMYNDSKLRKLFLLGDKNAYI